MKTYYQKIFQSLLILKDYCYRHECNSKCDFFLTGGGCSLRSGKSPKFWNVPNTIIKGMDCEELEPVIIEEEQNNESIGKDDKNTN